MNDIRYLLSIKELLDGSDKDRLLEVACGKLDAERLQKINKIINDQKRAESIGAGLLLQLGVQELCRASSEIATSESNNTDTMKLQLLTVSQVLKKLGAPIEIEYSYGEKNKPSFRNLPWHFNISHSEEYVFCVLSEQEVGVDIQYKKTFYNEGILRRFFTKEEQTQWSSYATQKERDEFFYQMWIRKEALGKLTGEGIAQTISVNMIGTQAPEEFGITWEHLDALSEYRMVICKWRESKE